MEIRDGVCEIMKKLEKFLSTQTPNPTPKRSMYSIFQSQDHNRTKCVAFLNMQEEAMHFLNPILIIIFEIN